MGASVRSFFCLKTGVYLPHSKKGLVAGTSKEFKSFFKTVGGNEGGLCHYPTRLDTYGCGCQHDCSYCYAKTLLEFRGLWNAKAPAVADVNEIYKVVKTIPKGTIIRLGGMTDCFMPLELQQRITMQTIKMLNRRGIGYLIVTKSHLVANDEYMQIYDKDLAHFQVTVTTLDDELSQTYEKASVPSKRIAAIHKLQAAGFDVAIRLSPIIEQYMDFDKLNGLGIQKAVVEFLRVNTWVKKWFDIDYTPFKLKQGGYQFMRLSDKKRIISNIKIPEITVCEDYTPHFKYWQVHVNPNKDDCCNLRRKGTC